MNRGVINTSLFFYKDKMKIKYYIYIVYYKIKKFFKKKDKDTFIY